MGLSCYATTKDSNNNKISIKKTKTFNEPSKENPEFPKKNKKNKKSNSKKDLNTYTPNNNTKVKKKVVRKSDNKDNEKDLNDNNKIKKNENKNNDDNNSNNNNKDIKKENKDNKKIKKRKKIADPNIYISSVNNQNNFYIVCPKCKLLFPEINDFSYDNDKKDFNISYTCECSKELHKSYLVDFLNKNKPFELNERFNKFKKANNLIKEAKHKEDFKGSEIIESALKVSLSTNGPAPPPLIKSSIKISSLGKTFHHIKESEFNPINEEEENVIEEEENNKVKKSKKNHEIIVSKAVRKSINVDFEEPLQKYSCIKTFQKNARISVLIQLDSGDLATGSYDCKICIWDINQPSGVEFKKEFQEECAIICLLEFKPGYLLVGTNENYISLWDLNENSKYLFVGHNLWVNSLAKCNEDKFASCSNDQNIIIWDYAQKNLIRKIRAHNDCILTLIKLNNGNLCSGGADLLTKIWNWEKGECLYMIEGFNNWIRGICEFNDMILICSGQGITVVKNFEIIEILEGHKHDVRDICVIDKDHFASSSLDNTIKIWNINTLSCEQTLEGHTSNVIDIIKLKGSDNLASCSYDYTIKIWGQE